MEELRANGVADIQGISYAIFETNGKISIIQDNNSNPSNGEGADGNKKSSFPFLFINDGKINNTALKMYQKNTNWLYKQLKKNNISDAADVMVAGVCENGRFYAQKKEK